VRPPSDRPPPGAPLQLTPATTISTTAVIKVFVLNIE